jgi:hypothetical protein
MACQCALSQAGNLEDEFRAMMRPLALAAAHKWSPRGGCTEEAGCGETLMLLANDAAIQGVTGLGEPSASKPLC